MAEMRERKLMITRGGDFVLAGGKFPRLAATDPAAMLREARDLLLRPALNPGDVLRLDKKHAVLVAG